MSSPYTETAAPCVLGAPLTLDPVPDGTGGCSAELELDPGWPIFAEHFPGRPMLPGSLTAHLMATVAAAVPGAEPGPRPASLRGVRFQAPLVPPARIRVTAAPDPAHGDTVRCLVLLLGPAGDTVAARGEVVRHG
ncbi:hypothetical protein [Streptacidiphilus sp. EB103A]|uniref:hypothetical protein n=1 Tax=Streptacidiphilus sp. EB103A TaxID=3156275 RepID=UPI003517353F